MAHPLCSFVEGGQPSFKEAGTLVSRYQLIVVIANSQQQGRGASMAKRSTKSCLVDREVRCVTEGVKSGLVIG